MNKSKNNKLTITGVIIVCIIIIAIIILIFKNINSNKNENVAENTNYPSYVTEIEDGVKLNQSSKMTDERVFGNYTISNMQLTTKSGMTTLLADVKNNSSSKTGLKVVEIQLLNENGEGLITLTGIIEELEPGASSQLNTSVTSDYIQAFDYTIKEK